MNNFLNKWIFFILYFLGIKSFASLVYDQALNNKDIDDSIELNKYIITFQPQTATGLNNPIIISSGNWKVSSFNDIDELGKFMLSSGNWSAYESIVMNDGSYRKNAIIRINPKDLPEERVKLILSSGNWSVME